MSTTIENLDTQESHEEVICDNIDNIEINDETEYFDCNGSDSPSKNQDEVTARERNVGKFGSFYSLCSV